ncbi:hypothetical protein NDU88_011209 [Pleurodeles waltl]|uniref:Uncharacterized protein n=1 Tax=Pleurodeles waltl TaxID=8319 RepID=A0AAV7PXI0_PLEWA|nr:hypothetical protein NDU88_011209 [Pleurodeles waltl]
MAHGSTCYQSMERCAMGWHMDLHAIRAWSGAPFDGTWIYMLSEHGVVHHLMVNGSTCYQSMERCTIGWHMDLHAIRAWSGAPWDTWIYMLSEHGAVCRGMAHGHACYQTQSAAPWDGTLPGTCGQHAAPFDVARCGTCEHPGRELSLLTPPHIQMKTERPCFQAQRDGIECVNPGSSQL